MFVDYVPDHPPHEVLPAHGLWGQLQLLWWWSGHPPLPRCLPGNRAGPAVWLALNICLIHMLHNYGHTSTISSAITLATLALAGLLYINNSDLFVLADPPLRTPWRLSTNYKATSSFGRVASMLLLGVPWQLTNAHGVSLPSTGRMANGTCTPSPPTRPPS